MTTKSVSFETTEDMVRFVDLVSRYDDDVYLKCGYYTVDAKSIISVLSMSTSKDIKMVVHGAECESLIQKVSQYICD